MCGRPLSRRISPPEKSAAAASRILVGAPARQPDLVRASRKSGSGAAEGSNVWHGPVAFRDIFHKDKNVALLIVLMFPQISSFITCKRFQIDRGAYSHDGIVFHEKKYSRTYIGLSQSGTAPQGASP